MNLDDLKLKLTAVFEPAPEGPAILKNCRRSFQKANPWKKQEPIFWMLSSR